MDTLSYSLKLRTNVEIIKTSRLDSSQIMTVFINIQMYLVVTVRGQYTSTGKIMYSSIEVSKEYEL